MSSLKICVMIYEQSNEMCAVKWNYFKQKQKNNSASIFSHISSHSPSLFLLQPNTTQMKPTPIFLIHKLTQPVNAIVVIPSHPWSWTISNLNKPLREDYPDNYVKQRQGTLTFHESRGGCSYKKIKIKSFIFCFFHLGFVEGCWSPTMEGDKYYEELGVAVRVVHMACSLCQRVQEGLVSMSSDQVKSKDDDSPVTVAGMYLHLKSLLSSWGLFLFLFGGVLWMWCILNLVCDFRLYVARVCLVVEKCGIGN